MTLDLQHGGIDFVDVSQAILAVALAGKPTLARVPVGDFALASRLVDAGAAAVIAPMIDDATTARRFAEHVKFPPLGRRSFGPRAALALTGFVGPAYLLGANAVTLAIAMIETSRSACFARRDLATPGIDGVFVGPTDLSISLHRGGAIDPDGPEVDRALTEIAARSGARQVRGPVLPRRPPRQGRSRAWLRATLRVDRPQPDVCRRAGGTRRSALSPRAENHRREGEDRRHLGGAPIASSIMHRTSTRCSADFVNATVFQFAEVNDLRSPNNIALVL